MSEERVSERKSGKERVGEISRRTYMQTNWFTFKHNDEKEREREKRKKREGRNIREIRRRGFLKGQIL